MLYMKSFETQLPVVIALSIVRAPIGPQIDSVVMAALEDKTTYGTMRLWGAVSFGIFSLVGGVVTATPTGSNTSTQDGPFMILFYVYGLCFILSGFVILWIVSDDMYKRSVKKKLRQERRALQQHNKDKEMSERTVSPTPVAVYDADHHMLQDGEFHASRAELIIVEASSDLNQMRDVSAGQTELASKLDESLMTVADSDCIGDARSRSDSSAESVESSGREESRLNMRAALTQVVRKNPTVLVFALVVFLSGFGAGAIDSYLFIYLKELGGTGLLMGLARFMTCVAEVPIFQVAGGWQKTYGTWPMLVVTQFAFVVRFVYYALLVEPWAVLPCEMLNGITFAVTWNVSCTYANEISPPGCQGVMQAVLEGLHFGIGYGVGSLVGGFVYESLGAVHLFQFCGMLSLFSAILAIFAWRYSSTHGHVEYVSNSSGDGAEMAGTSKLYSELSQEENRI